jgi:hypothetical protein
MSEYNCNICEKEREECVCVSCRRCGRDERPDELYNGKCRWCEDDDMVRGIR